MSYMRYIIAVWCTLVLGVATVRLQLKRDTLVLQVMESGGYTDERYEVTQEVHGG